MKMEIRSILVSAGESLDTDTVSAIAKLCLSDELRT